MTIHFLLTPDSSSARRLKRLVSEQAARVGVIVGTWPELLDTTAKAYLVPVPGDIWEEKVGSAIRSMEGVFWSRSLEVAESETIRAVIASLRMLLEGTTPGKGTGPEKGLPEVDSKLLTDRALRHYNDLLKLHAETEKTLPDELTLIRNIFERSADDALRRIRVYALEYLPRLNQWQSALIEQLSSDCVEPPDSALESLLLEIVPAKDSRKTDTAAKALARNLFDKGSIPVPLDQSVQWLGVRDHLEEAEVACGIIQEALRSDQNLSWTDFSLLLPDASAYAWAIREVFRRAGLPLSGLPEDACIRDLGREAVLYFLLCRKRPAPNMALAVLATSPLMPWPGAVGYGIAQSIMAGNYDFKFDDHADKNWKRVWKLIRESEEQPAKLKSAIREFVSLLTYDDEKSAGYLTHARTAAQSAGLVLEGVGDVPWEKLLEAVVPETVSVSGSVVATIEGITVFTEHREPWRQSKKLLVLGFSEGRYPSSPHTSPVFFDEDIATLKSEGNLDIQTQEDLLTEGRALFKRQLSSTAAVTFFVPRRNGLGGALTPSQSLPFMARLFGVADKPESLILDLEKSEDRLKAAGIAIADAGAPISLRERDVSDIRIGRDLVMLRTDGDGNPGAQSPSRLGTLMTSPFAWLLDYAEIKAGKWSPEELSVAEKGTLAHKVFENLFVAGKVLPGEKKIQDIVSKLLNDAIIKICPYMLAPEWRTERKNLEGEIITAALAWRILLKNVGASVIEVEPWISGIFENIPIHGRADVILSLGGKLVVVDYKKSGSKARRKQMQKGFDSQATLYRTMLQTGTQEGTLADELKGDPEVGIMYYLLNDQTALTDTSEWIGHGTAGVEEMGQNVSLNAISLIREKLDEVRKGLVKLNTTADENRFKTNAGITIYALKDNPLVQLFMREEEE